jgi:hypothetical protein
MDRKSPSPVLEAAVTLAAMLCTGINSCKEPPLSSSSMVIAIDHQGSLIASLAPSLATQLHWPSLGSSLKMRLIITVTLMTVLIQCFSSKGSETRNLPLLPGGWTPADAAHSHLIGFHCLRFTNGIILYTLLKFWFISVYILFLALFHDVVSCP